MTTFHITWRPSGGRGEYEYSHEVDSEYEDKPIHLVVDVDGIKTVIKTDAHLEQTGGKRRIRREAPNDRTHLSVPALVAALIGLPKPTRDRNNLETPALVAGRWAVGAVELEILSKKTADVLRVRPVSVKPRHFTEAIGVTERLEVLVDESKQLGDVGDKVSAHLALIKAGVSDVSLDHSAQLVFDTLSHLNGDFPALASPKEVSVFEALMSADDAVVPVAEGKEGRKRVVAHALRERNKGLIKQKKTQFKKIHGRIFCECCELEPVKMYGEDVDGIIEVHHKVPLNECADDEIRLTSIADLILLCRNCHGVAHRLSPMPDLDGLRELLLMRPKLL